MGRIRTEDQYKIWDRVSGWSKAETAANSTLVKRINGIFGTYIMPGDTVLDFGCGTGTITLRMARKAARVYGVDVSEGMLKRAQQNLTEQGIANASFLRLTALNEMFGKDSFEVATIFNVLQYVENRKELFDGFHALLKPGGTLIIAAPCFAGMNSLSTLFVKFLRFAGIMPRTYFFSVDGIEKEIRDAGFTIVESSNLSGLPERFIVARKG